MALLHVPVSTRSSSTLARSSKVVARFGRPPRDRLLSSRSLHIRLRTPPFPAARRPSVPNIDRLTPFATALRVGGIRSIFIQTENTPNSDVSITRFQIGLMTDVYRPSNSSLIIPSCQKVFPLRSSNICPQDRLWPPHIHPLSPLDF